MNLLIVDDNPTNLKLLHVQLEAEGHAVLDASDGIEALRVAASEPVDAIISDILMPNMDGFRLCLEIRKSIQFRSLPFIFYTSTYNSPEDRQLAQSVGADQYIVKPAPMPVVLEALHQAVRKARDPSNPSAPKFDESHVLKQYNEALVHKLEEKNLELELANEQLREKEAGLRRAELMTKLAHVITRPDGSFERWSETLTQLTGIESAQMPRSAREWLDLLHPDDRAVCLEKAIEAGVTGMRTDVEYRLRRADGAWIHARQVMEPFQSQTHADGKTYWFNTIQDITEQKLAEIRIRGLNRVYAVLSGINTLIIRAQDRDELFREACRIAVEHGNFGMAWIGQLDRETLDVTPVAWHGMDGEVAAMKASARGDIPEGQGMVGRAIREKKPVITNDINADPGAGGPRRREALRRGFQSIISMPLTVNGEVTATLTLFAKERNFFNEDELKLLTELAGDISFALDHIEKGEKLNYLAYYDALTGLANAALFHERVDQHVHEAGPAQRKLAVILIDVDRFKTINDTLGRHTGDEILKQTGKRLLRHVGNVSHLARIGADRFAMVMPDVETEQEVARRIEGKLGACFGEPFRIGDTELRTSAKVGIAMFPSDGASADALFRNAESALKKAKASGERYLFYTEQMTERIAGKLALENKLRQALERREFVLHYQPKFDSATKAIEGVEALIRWQSPELGLVPPMQFIPLLEETGLIFEVGAWALRQAAYDYHRWRKLGLRAPRVAVNVSAFQLRQRDFIESVRSALGEGSGSAPIDLELTESLIMEDIRASTEKLEALRALGVNIAIDDFGTGYSSLAYLVRLPVQSLKIDRSFVVAMLDDPAVMTLVSTIVSLGKSLKLNVVGEGVDSEGQADALRKLGCDQMQGYLFSKPLPFEEMAALLRGKPTQGAAQEVKMAAG